MHIILFEDNEVSRLSPISTGKPAFSISVGSLRLIDLVRRLEGDLELIVRPHLKELVRENYPETWTPAKGPRKGPFLLINARTVPTAAILSVWQSLMKDAGNGAVLYHDRTVVAAWLGAAAKFPEQEMGSGQLTGLIQDMRLAPMKKTLKADMLETTCDVIRHHLNIIDSNLEYRLSLGQYREVADGVFIPNNGSPEPTIGDYFVSDSRKGPILIESGVDIGPFCLLRGPVYIGENSKVIESAAIKDKVAINRVCKIGGEVEASTIEPYTNKQHHGFLGHSYLGSWVNLGAGTCNSDLKNSYNDVCMDTVMGKVPSGMQFLGCVIGDYSKTASIQVFLPEKRLVPVV